MDTRKQGAKVELMCQRAEVKSGTQSLEARTGDLHPYVELVIERPKADTHNRMKRTEDETRD